MSDLEFLKKYEDLLNKDYCNCNEMNCIDNNSPRRILNIAKNQQKEIERLKNIINEVNKQLNYLETYSSKEDVFEDIKRRLDSIEKIINRK